MANDPLLLAASRSARRRQRFLRRASAFLFNTLFLAVFFLLAAWALSGKPANADYPGGGSGYPRIPWVSRIPRLHGLSRLSWLSWLPRLSWEHYRYEHRQWHHQ